MVFAKTGIGSRRCLKLGRVLCCGVFFLLPALVMSRAAQADTSLKFEKSAVYGDGLDQTGNAIESKDGRLYIAGGESAANMKALSVGYEAPPAGDPIFNFRWQSDPSVPTEETFTDVAAAPEGLYFAGQSRSARTKQSWPFLVKFSNTGGKPSGAPAWLARPQLFDRYQEGVFYAALPVQEGTGAAIYATGYASSRQSNRIAVLAKYDPNGKLLWFKKLSDEDERSRGAGLGLAEHNGSIYVGGYTDKGERKGDVDNIPLYTTLWKYDSSGKEIWRKKDEDSRLHVIKGDLQDVKVDLAASEDFLYLSAAKKKDEEAGVLLLKYDSDGEQLWSAQWDAKAYSGAARAGFPSGIIADKDRLYVAGWTTSSSKKGATPNEDAFVLEVDKEYGFVIAVHEHGEPARQERALGVETDGAGVYVAGLQRSAASKGKSAQNDLTLLQYKIQPIMNVKIEIQPQTKKPAKKEKGKKNEEEKKGNESSKIAVTILSDSKFNPTTDVRTKSLTFGRTGHEPSWDSCGIKDVNSDGTLDLVCYFEPQFKFQKERQDIFQEGDTYGILRGDTASGTPLVGKAKLRADKTDPDPVKEEEEEAAAPPAPAPEILISAPVTSPEAPVEPPQVETSPATTTQEPVSVPTTSVEAPPQVDTPTTTTEPETSTVTTTPQVLISAPVTSPEEPVQSPQVETSTTTAEPETLTVTTTQEPVSAPTTLTEEPLRSPQVETSTATAEPETTTVTTQDPVSAPTTLTEEPLRSPQVETSTATTEIKTSTATITQQPVAAPVTSTAVSTAQFETAPTTTLKDPITTTSLPTVTATVTNTTETAPKNITTLQTPTLISAPHRTTNVSSPVSTAPVPATTPPAAPVPAVVPAAGIPAHIENIPAPVQTPLRVLGSGPGTGKATSTARVSPAPDSSGGVLRSLESPAYQAPKSSPEKTDPATFSSSGPDSGSAQPEAASGLAQAYNDMGREVLESGKAQEAVVYFEEALKLNPKSVEAHTYAGLALVKAGRLGEAKKHLLKAAKLKPNDEAIKKQLQEVLEQLGEEEDLSAPDESGNESDPESADK